MMQRLPSTSEFLLHELLVLGAGKIHRPAPRDFKHSMRVANFLGRLMSESRLGSHDLKSNAAPDCFQPQKTGCRPHCLRLPLWTTPSHSQDFLQVHISCLRFFYLVRPFWHFSLERSFILLTIDLISLSWFSPFVWSSMFLPSSFTTLLVFPGCTAIKARNASRNSQIRQSPLQLRMRSWWDRASQNDPLERSRKI